MEQLSFEQAFQQLDQVVRQLEDGGLSLEQSIRLYEEGMRLATFCESKLNEADQRISQLAANGSAALGAARFMVED